MDEDCRTGLAGDRAAVQMPTGSLPLAPAGPPKPPQLSAEVPKWLEDSLLRLRDAGGGAALWALVPPRLQGLGGRRPFTPKAQNPQRAAAASPPGRPAVAPRARLHAFLAEPRSLLRGRGRGDGERSVSTSDWRQLRPCDQLWPMKHEA